MQHFLFIYLFISTDAVHVPGGSSSLEIYLRCKHLWMSNL